MTRTFKYKLNGKTGKVDEIETTGQDPNVDATVGMTLVRPEVSFVSSTLCRWDKDHAAVGGKFTKEGKPIVTSRHQAQEYSRRSAGEHDVYNTWGDIDGL